MLTISGISHGYNMFGFPYYENDEGVYMSQAWSLLTKGQLAPYTYWYDHAPMGWIVIAIWTKLTGGFFTFGISVNSGRVLMLALHIFSTALILFISKRLTKSYIPGIIGTILFSLSPLAIYYQRRVLLDNIMIFFVLFSITTLITRKVKLTNVILSAISFGTAVLVKENAIFFIPAFIYLLYIATSNHNKMFAIIKWLAIVSGFVSLYFLYAILKGEFFPVGFLGDNGEHVSLMTTLEEQAGRGVTYPIWDTRGDIYRRTLEWFSKDFFLIYIGISSILIGLVLSFRNKAIRIFTFFILGFCIFLTRGSLVLDFYIVPLIPLLSLQVGFVLYYFLNLLKENKKIYIMGLSLVTILFIIYPFKVSSDQYTRNETESQIAALQWIKTNLDEDSKIAIDNYSYLDLHTSNKFGDKVFKDADWFQKLNLDPKIRSEKYNNDWRNIEYIALSHEMIRQVKLVPEDLKFLKRAFENAKPVISWTENSTAYLDFDNYISTNGDWMAIYKVEDKSKIALKESWHVFRDKYLISYGQIIDTENNDITTSEGQSYAMLMSVIVNDQNTFEGVWAWTQDHMQHRLEDKLFSWLVEKNEEGDYSVTDSASAADSDQDIALALLAAYKKWGNKEYLDSAKLIIEDIWSQEVVRINGRYYLTAGASVHVKDGYLVNPSYLSPAHYEIFSRVDTKNNWKELKQDSYQLLNQLSKKSQSSLPPNWVFVSNSGSIQNASRYFNNKENVDDYGFDAFRIFWRVALDAKWNNNQNAYDYLNMYTSFFENELEKGKLYSVYSVDGKPVVDYDAQSTNTAALSTFSITDIELSNDFYKNRFEDKVPENLYSHSWTLFSSALYSNNLPNLWEE